MHERQLIPTNLDEHFFIKPPADGTDLLRVFSARLRDAIQLALLS